MCVEQIHEMKSNPKREEGDPRKGEKRVRVKRNQRRSVFINNTHKAAQRIKYRDRSLVHSSEDGGAVGKGECCLQPEPSKCLVEPLVLRPHSKQNAVRQFPQTIWFRLFFLMWTFLQFGQSRPVAMLDFLSTEPAFLRPGRIFPLHSPQLLERKKGFVWKTTSFKCKTRNTKRPITPQKPEEASAACNLSQSAWWTR